MGLVALVALACAWPGLVPTVALGVFFWISARRGTERARDRLVSYGVIVAAVYAAPLANFWLATVFHPALHGPAWRADWSRYFPIVPGAVQTWLVASVEPGTVHFAPVASVMTAAWIYVLTLIAGRTRIRRIIVAICGLACSAFASWMVTFVTFLIPT